MYGEKKKLVKNTFIQSFIKNNKRGFTLLELLVVFSLTIIITGVGFVSFAQYSSRQQLDQTSQDVKFIFDQARFNAVSSVKPQYCIDNDIAIVAYRVDVSDFEYGITALCGPAEEEILITVKKVPTGMILDNAADCTGIEFSTLTNKISKPGYSNVMCSMELVSGTGSKILRVQSNGTVKIE